MAPPTILWDIGAFPVDCARLQSKTWMSLKHVADGELQVVALVCGYPEAAAEATSTWLEFLVAQLQHGFPGLTVRAGLPSLLDRSLGERGASDGWQLSTLQQLLEVRKCSHENISFSLTWHELLPVEGLGSQKESFASM